VIHFAVTFGHFHDDALYGAFFLVLAWAQLLWPVVLTALSFSSRRTAGWLWLGIVGNVGVLAIYFSSRSIGLPIGPDATTVESWGGLDLVCAVEEILLVAIAAAVLARPGLPARPIRFRSAARSLGGLLAMPASLVRFEDVNAAIAAGYTDRLETNGEEHLLYAGDDNAYQGLDPQHPSSLVYAINVPGHAPILLGAMYMMPDGVDGPQVGGGLTEWHSHLQICQGGKVIIAGFDVELGGRCDPSTWKDRYTTQMLHVWVVPYSGGVFSDDLSTAATTAAAQAALALTKPGQLAP
jgi:hypothetical protein